MPHELIMIVEDEVIIAKETELLLKEWGYDTVSASSGEEAIELVLLLARKMVAPVIYAIENYGSLGVELEPGDYELDGEE